MSSEASHTKEVDASVALNTDQIKKLSEVTFPRMMEHK
jgi:hypothetical protein